MQIQRYLHEFGYNVPSNSIGDLLKRWRVILLYTSPPLAGPGFNTHPEGVVELQFPLYCRKDDECVRGLDPGFEDFNSGP